MRRHSVLTTAALLLLLDSYFTTPLRAADLGPLSGIELHRRCLAYTDAPQSADSRSCAAYIHGFIDGSPQVQFYTDETAVHRRESFSDRALRTRLGLRPDPQPLYCVNDSVSLSKFIAQMLTHLDDHPPHEDMSASVVLYATLQRFHRCGV